jgi:hypothetical protein
MNCALCSGYLAYRNDTNSKGVRMPYCTGCRPRDKKCAFLRKRCDLILYGKIEYCYECDDFPCRNLQHLDKRYRTFYRMSMIENLEYIRDRGMESFLAGQEERWKCPECGETLCCHNGICFNCGLEKLKNKRHRYRWEED